MVMARLPEPTEPVTCLPSLDRLSVAAAGAFAFLPAWNSADHLPSIPAADASVAKHRKAGIQARALRMPQQYHNSLRTRATPSTIARSFLLAAQRAVWLKPQSGATESRSGGANSRHRRTRAATSSGVSM